MVSAAAIESCDEVELAWLQTSMSAGLACAMTSFTMVLPMCGHSVFSRWLNQVTCACNTTSSVAAAKSNYLAGL